MFYDIRGELSTVEIKAPVFMCQRVSIGGLHIFRVLFKYVGVSAIVGKKIMLSISRLE